MTAIAPILITNPWAHGTTAPADVVIPLDTTSNTIANQVDGFPSSQEKDPLVGGEYVKRAEMNGVFKLYSLLLNFINQGGQFTFNPAVATSGGYDAGVILYCAPDNTFQRSLINGNTANFILTSSFRNDGINWSTAFDAGDITANSLTTVQDIVSTLGSLRSHGNFYSDTSGVDVLTDIISRAGGFSGTKNGIHFFTHEGGNSAYRTIRSDRQFSNYIADLGALGGIGGSAGGFRLADGSGNNVTEICANIGGKWGYRMIAPIASDWSPMLRERDITYVTSISKTALMSLNQNGTYNVVITGLTTPAATGAAFVFILPLSEFGITSVVGSSDYFGTVSVRGNMSGFTGHCQTIAVSNTISVMGTTTNSLGTYEVFFSICFIATK